MQSETFLWLWLVICGGVFIVVGMWAWLTNRRTLSQTLIAWIAKSKTNKALLIAAVVLAAGWFLIHILA